MGILSSAVNLQGNKISAAAVEEAAMQLSEMLSTSDVRTVVIYSIFDNNTFFCAGDDGSRTLPAKNGGDDRYHVPGRLVVAGHDVVKSLVNTSIPLLRAGGEKEKIILSPLPRYLIPCCGNRVHITNRCEANFKQDLMSQLAETKKSIKDWCLGRS
jgi:hypothetical protein